VLLEQPLGRGDYNSKHVDKVACQREGTIAFVLEDGVIHDPSSTHPRGEQLIAPGSASTSSSLSRVTGATESSTSSSTSALTA